MFRHRLISCLVFGILVCNSFCDDSAGDNDKKFNEIESVIERPCPYFDLLCIRQYFAKFSDCKIAEGPVPDPLFVSQVNLFVPATNISVTLRNAVFRNLNGVISEFYINKLTDLLVLAVDFRNVADSIFTTFKFHRTGQEPAITNATLNEIYPSFTITTVFRRVNHLRLEETESHIFLDALPAFTIEPSVAAHPDPNVARMYAEFVAVAPVSYHEAFLVLTTPIISNFIQFMICDFGLKIF